MMNSAPAVVGASDGLAAFRSIIAKRGPALAWARGAALRVSACGLTDRPIVTWHRVREGDVMDFEPPLDSLV